MGKLSNKIGHGFLDRLAYAGGKYLAYKPAAICASARRAGTTSALDQLVKYPESWCRHSRSRW